MNKSKSFKQFDPTRVPSPCFVVDEVAVRRNLEVLAHVQQASGAKILLALKAFSMFSLAPLISQYLSGTCSSGLYETRLGREEFGGEVHTFSAAYTEADLKQILQLSHHVVFNSFGQWKRFQHIIQSAKAARPELHFGLRLNPLHSEGATPIYDPCAPGSRLGIPTTEFNDENFEDALSEGISGLHFHTLCEQDFGALDRTLAAIENQFADKLSKLDWVNFGGGHHITGDGYQVQPLIERIKQFQDKYQVQVYMEPGEAIAINTGVLVTEVLDLTFNSMDLAILDTSATCHMPDTIEMPYRADIFNAGQHGQYLHNYRLGGQTCLAGDVMGDYSFKQPLQIGQRLLFDDMSHYTMVKTTTFNGIGLPALALWNSETDALKVIREFAYEDFKTRLS
jgi:carboxynorspermidine decarboxylase